MSLIKTPFSFASTAGDVIAGVDLSGKRAVVTGASSGIGVETARALAAAGAAVTLAVRNVQAGERVASDIVSQTGNADIAVAMLELADSASIGQFVRRWEGPLHLLVNNAGIMASPEGRTEAGRELQFATNHLGHFALSVGLHDALAEARGARIVAVSSNAHLMSPVVFDDLDFRFRPYDPWLAYAQSKTANILFAVEATRRWRADRIIANALNPGAILTGLQKHVGGRLTTPPDSHKTVPQGAATSVLLAASPLLEGVGGRYFNDCNEAHLVGRRPESLGEMGPCLAPYAVDGSHADSCGTCRWSFSPDSDLREASDH